MEKKYTSEERKQVLELYTLGFTRPSKIANILFHAMTMEKIKTIITDYQKEEYKGKKINNVSYEQILNLYEEGNKVLDILQIYPELTFGQIKHVVEDYYQMLAIKKPEKIIFPRAWIRDYLKTHSIEDAVEEFGYEKKTLLKKLNETKPIEQMTKEELFQVRMRMLESDICCLENHKLSVKKFQKKYPGLDPQKVRPLIEEYKKQQKQ